MTLTQRQYAIVAGDLVRGGGMDAPNYALASYLARAGGKVHVVAYRIADDLRNLRNIVFHRVPNPQTRTHSGRLSSPRWDWCGQ